MLMCAKRIPVLRLRAFASCDEGTDGGFDAMEAVAWDLGHEPVTAIPDECDPMLVHLVHHVNDTYCGHMTSGGGVDWLCRHCSETVLSLAYRTVGTVLSGRTQIDRARIHVRVALEQAARAVDVLGPTPYTRHVLEVVGRWVSDPAAVADDQLSELVEGRPSTGLAVERIVGDVAAAAASAETRECARVAGRSAAAAVEARQPQAAIAGFLRIIDHFKSLSNDGDLATAERRVVWLR